MHVPWMRRETERKEGRGKKETREREAGRGRENERARGEGSGRAGIASAPTPPQAASVSASPSPRPAELPFPLTKGLAVAGAPFSRQQRGSKVSGPFPGFPEPVSRAPLLVDNADAEPGGGLHGTRQRTQDARLTQHQHLATRSRTANSAGRCVSTCGRRGRDARQGRLLPRARFSRGRGAQWAWDGTPRPPPGVRRARLSGSAEHRAAGAGACPWRPRAGAPPATTRRRRKPWKPCFAASGPRGPRTAYARRGLK